MVKTKISRNKKIIIGILTLVALIVIAGTIYSLQQPDTGSSEIPAKTPETTDNQANQNGDKDFSQSAGNTSPSTTTDTGATPKSNSNTGATLIKPSGAFVSNHQPSLSGASSPSAMQSVCNTTAGASCTITFVNSASGVTKTLAAQTTDKNGSAFWSWDVKSAGFSEGSWKITATATLNGQSSSSEDTLALEVKP